MRIYDDESNKKLDSVMIFLTKDEMQQLLGYAKQLLEKHNCDHFHLSSDDYQKEITLCIYDPENTQQFDKRSQQLIQQDE